MLTQEEIDFYIQFKTMIIYPNKRLCPNKAVSYPISQYNPFLWIANGNTEFSAFCIDGFIINKEKKVNGIFQKLEYKGAIRSIEIEEIIDFMGEQNLISSIKLAKQTKTLYRLFVWPFNFPQGYSDTEAFIQSFDLDISPSGKGIVVNRKLNITLLQLSAGIEKLRGSSFNSVKPLKVGTSFVECYLANNTFNPWPGDADAILFSNTLNVPSHIIEFKTHNIDKPTEDEFIGKYGTEDWRRFDVLFNLQNNLYVNTGYKPKILYIAWGTKNIPNHKNIKIDVIEKGATLSTQVFPKPHYDIFCPDLFDLISIL